MNDDEYNPWFDIAVYGFAIPPLPVATADNANFAIWAEGHEDHVVYAFTRVGAEWQAFRLGLLSWFRLSPRRVSIARLLHN